MPVCVIYAKVHKNKRFLLPLNKNVGNLIKPEVNCAVANMKCTPKVGHETFGVLFIYGSAGLDILLTLRGLYILFSWHCRRSRPRY